MSGLTFAVRQIDHGFDRLMADIEKFKNGGHIKVGVIDDGKGAADHGGITTAELAGIHELGSTDGHIPERSFIRSTFTDGRARYLGMLRGALGLFIEGKLQLRVGLEAVGLRMTADIKNAVTQGPGIPPPNAPATIEAKGSDRPLVDTGQLVNAVTHAVVLG